MSRKKIECCGGEYHVLLEGRYYCMAPPNIDCAQLKKGAGQFTKGEKVPFCCHKQIPCSECKEAFKSTFAAPVAQ